MGEIFKPLADVAKTLGYWPTLILFAVGLIAFLTKFFMEVRSDTASGRDRRAASIAEAFRKIAELKGLNLSEREYSAARTAILRQYGISATEFSEREQIASRSTSAKLVWGGLGGATAPILYIIPALFINPSYMMRPGLGWDLFWVTMLGAGFGCLIAYNERSDFNSFGVIYGFTLFSSWFSLIVVTVLMQLGF